MEIEDSLKTMELLWYGPYKWFDANGRSLFSANVASQCGIYMWTIAHEGCHLAYYIGETGKSPARTFAKRMDEHAKAYLSGVYRIHDPSEFAAGRQRLIWPGTWYGPIGPQWPPFATVRPKLYQTIGQLYLLLAPVQDEYVRKRIEKSVAKATQRFPRPTEPAGGFQEPGIVYRVKPGVPFRVRMKCAVEVVGLDSELIA